MRAILDTTEPTRNEIERRLARLIRRAGLPRPRFNALLCGYEVDALWEAERLVVETDGWDAHGHRAAFERDRARDADLTARGYAVLRFTWRQIVDRPDLVAARIAAALARRPRQPA
jgi:very-short-patch-repair endonuclease